MHLVGTSTITTPDGPFDIPGEDWKPVPGASRYSVSRLGNIWARGTSRTRSGFRKLTLDASHGYLRVDMAEDSGTWRFRYVHEVVASAFHGPRPAVDQEVRHKNDVKTDCRAGNLVYGSKSMNGHDAVANGVHFMAARESCKWGHLFTERNTRVERSRGKTSRVCRACVAADYQLGGRKHPDFQAVSDRAFRRIEGLPERQVIVIPTANLDEIRTQAADTERDFWEAFTKSLDADLVSVA